MLMEGDPFLLIEGMAIAAVAVGATMGYVYIRSEYPHAFDVFSRAIERARAGGLLGPSVLGSATRLRHRGPARRGRLYLRRGDLDAREPRGQARPGARQAAAARDLGLVRQADGHQQRAELRLGPLDPRAWGEGLRGLRRRTVARLAAVPARGQRPLRRPHRARLRRDDPRACRGLRRRNALRPPDPRGPGRRTARRLFSRKPARHAARLRIDARRQGHARPRRNRRLRRQRRHGAPGAFRLPLLRQGKLRQVHPLPHRLDRAAPKRSTRSSPARTAKRTSNFCAIFAR